jgi:hypothetical protein
MRWNRAENNGGWYDRIKSDLDISAERGLSPGEHETTTLRQTRSSNGFSKCSVRLTGDWLMTGLEANSSPAYFQDRLSAGASAAIFANVTSLILFPVIQMQHIITKYSFGTTGCQ